MHKLHPLALHFCAALLIVFAGARAEDYPNKAVRIVVPYPAGGTTDIMARLLAQKLAEGLGQAVIVDNKPGAGGGVGTALVAKSVADGYTITFGNIGPNAINPSIYRNLQYDAEKDFSPISVFSSVPFILVVPVSSPVHNLRALIELGRASSGALNFASVGIGSVSHVTGELFNAAAGTKFVHVPYKGGAPALTGTIQGDVSLMFATSLEATPHLRSGKLRAMGISSAQRSPVAPDIPTLAEAGLPGFEVSVWFGLLAPAGTPRAIVERLNAEIGKVLIDPIVKARLADLAAVPMHTSPEEFSAMVRADIAKWAKVVRDTGIKAE
ncbi:MAG: tripartite tricarboxylate transporter substrate binding protein [Betaproteobacteria bacterium]|nr:tripartite tricarboxylate transporter substrate binding protein [Betaproteobacteria bacterium]